ncbi:MAG: TonB family protein [Massilibacteroides sp.]|nr:TonB family protein [Massilibacteroides sp.]MDD3062199.1 TonB family protein [Massilibacteroides sp.]MDD4114425.1 TonB family protein [Massilibacteroides sp.]MDD4659717.1 TonB family protein [Massilibacteroides sp.]
MTPELTYFIKVNVALVLLYGFYRIFFYKDTYFMLRRLLLLSFFVLAFSYPLFDIQDWVKAQQPIAEVISSYSAILPEMVVDNTETLSWAQVCSVMAWVVYFLVAAALFLRFLIQFASILRIKRQSKKAIIHGVPVHLLSRPANPFSFFRLIYIYPANHSEKELEEILAHEYTHVNQWHSIDVIISELFTIVCWLNPFVWLIKREIRHNLEYLADNSVIHSGYDSKDYQYHLLGLAHHPSIVTLYNNFNVLDLKNRIMMMNKKRSSKMGRTKYLIFIPLTALLMLVSNIEAVARITKNLAANITANATPVKVKGTVIDESGGPIIGASVIIKGTNIGTITDLKGGFTLEAAENATLSVSFIGFLTEEVTVSRLKTNPQIKLSAETEKIPATQVFTVVEEMPKFPGGDAELLKFIAQNVKYPEIARQNGIQGRVIASFVVEKDGSTTDPVVVRAVDPSLDAEAIRVISLFPKWEPGKQRGQAVRVKYTVPIIFSLRKANEKTINPESSKEEVVVVGYGIPQKETIKPESSKEGDVFTVVDEMPQFPGGDAELLKYVAQNVKYPVDAQKNGIQGRVICSFVVMKDGSIQNIRVVRGVSPSLDEEAIRVISVMPRWTPGKQRGKPVNVKYTVPITFRIQ